ncbi:hypothetical protein EW146_g7419 [Bondarzewia mesenterica]|uniref:Uncharacterized protein n=1 Tax=Bondarzewia mesenterica TaxID=1095465 RepID=A0A4S4LLF4_9AGAM|nr:hypothetical protein EW146_g7419 [Bondarzewia mesenterica]
MSPAVSTVDLITAQHRGAKAGQKILLPCLAHGAVLEIKATQATHCSLDLGGISTTHPRIPYSNQPLTPLFNSNLSKNLCSLSPACSPPPFHSSLPIHKHIWLLDPLPLSAITKISKPGQSSEEHMEKGKKAGPLPPTPPAVNATTDPVLSTLLSNHSIITNPTVICLTEKLQFLDKRMWGPLPTLTGDQRSHPSPSLTPIVAKAMLSAPLPLISLFDQEVQDNGKIDVGVEDKGKKIDEEMGLGEGLMDLDSEADANDEADLDKDLPIKDEGGVTGRPAVGEEGSEGVIIDSDEDQLEGDTPV